MTASQLLSGIQRLRVLIVGDVCLDHWCTYDPTLSLPSAETGIPRLAVTRSDKTPGAAGTVAMNLKSLGVGEISILGVVGDDGHGFELIRALNQREIATDLIVHEAATPTFTYTKLINSATNEEDRPRVDFIFAGRMPSSANDAICGRLREFASHFDLICVSDQAETESGGVVTEEVRRELREIACQGALVWVDSRRRSELFHSAAIKMNELEFREALARAGTASASALQDFTAARLLMVTHGGNGVTIADASGERFRPTQKVANPVDICGAGDSFSAGAATALALGASAEDAARLGHLVASVTIMQKGTGAASPAQVLAAEAKAGGS